MDLCLLQYKSDCRSHQIVGVLADATVFAVVLRVDVVGSCASYRPRRT